MSCSIRSVPKPHALLDFITYSGRGYWRWRGKETTTRLAGNTWSGHCLSYLYLHSRGRFRRKPIMAGQAERRWSRQGPGLQPTDGGLAAMDAKPTRHPCPPRSLHLYSPTGSWRCIGQFGALPWRVQKVSVSRIRPFSPNAGEVKD